jgi:antitoxin component YwqK of YwqJK toxin-antitoxin module
MHKQNYTNGKGEGAFVEYFSDGQIWSKCSYRDDKSEGVWVVYRGDGTLHSLLTGTYKDGVKISD